MANADVVLHIDETLDPEGESRLQETLSAVPGVTGIRHNPARGHLWVVNFEPNRLRPQAVLGAAERAGYHGELVGL